jgi:hypothetical protein
MRLPQIRITPSLGIAAATDAFFNLPQFAARFKFWGWERWWLVAGGWLLNLQFVFNNPMSQEELGT